MTSDQEMRALAGKATEGPWEDNQDDLTNDWQVVHDQEQRWLIAQIGGGDWNAKNDAAFIAASREWVPDALTRFAAIRELHQPDWSDWDIDHPEEEANCTCGYNGSYSECPTVRILDRSES